MCVCHSWFYIKLIRIATDVSISDLQTENLHSLLKMHLFEVKTYQQVLDPPKKREHQVRMEFFNKCGVSKSVSSYPKESSSTIVGS